MRDDAAAAATRKPLHLLWENFGYAALCRLRDRSRSSDCSARRSPGHFSSIIFQMPSRSLLAIILAIGIAWQAYAISVAMRFGPPLAKFMAGLGVEPNAITRAFVATYLWWFVIPLVCAIVSIDV